MVERAGEVGRRRNPCEGVLKASQMTFSFHTHGIGIEREKRERERKRERKNDKRKKKLWVQGFVVVS